MNEGGESTLESLFHAARALPREQRSAVLMAQCQDPDLRAEVMQLLACADGPTIVEHLSGVQVPVVPRFRIIRLLGEGGFAVVYQAEQQEPVRRIVAIKIGRWASPGDRRLDRFQQEMQILASLHHPGIARLYEAGTTADGRAMLVIEYIAGLDIAAYCRERACSIRRRIELLACACDAVHYANQNGVIHRDLKPSNILVPEVSGEPTPKVIDFGAAKWMRPDGDSGLTVAGDLIGTPAYMSPEQIRQSTTDVRTDVFALGAILYELLTGSSPLHTTCAPDADLAALLVHARDPHHPLASVAAAQRGDRNAARLIRGDLDAILDKALRSSPAERYSSVAELAADLRRYLADEGVLAARPNTWVAAKRFARRHRVAVATSGVALGSLLLGLFGTSVGLVRAQREAVNAQALCEILIETLTQADPLASGANATVRGLLDAATVQLSDRAGAIHSEVLARTRAVLGRSYAGLGLYEQAERELRGALVTSSGENVLPPVVRAGVLREYADAIRRREGWEESEHTLGEALALVSGGSRDERIERIRVLRSRSNLRAAMQQLDDALEDSTAATREADALPDCPAALRLHCQAWHGAILRAREQFSEAEQVIRAALADAEQAMGPRHQLTGMIMTDLADTLLFSGRSPDAEPLARRALDIREQALGASHPYTINSVVTLAACCAEIGQTREAELLRNRAAELRSMVNGPDSEPVAMIHYLAGLDALDRGDFAAAIRGLGARVKCFESRPVDPPIALATSRVAYAAALLLGGDIDGADAQLDLVQHGWDRTALNPSVALLMDACLAALQHRRYSCSADPGQVESILVATKRLPMLASRKRLILRLLDAGEDAAR